MARPTEPDDLPVTKPRLERPRPVWQTSDSRSNLIVIALTLVLGLQLSMLRSKIGFLEVSFFVVAIAAIMLTIIAVTAVPTQKALVKMSDDLSNALSEIRQQRLYEHIWTNDQLLAFEQKCQAREIWLLTSDLIEDATGGPFAAAVRFNLERGVQYRYFVPDVAEVHSRIAQIRSLHGKHNNLSFTLLSSDFFFLVEDLDIVIYNPMKEGTVGRVAFMGLPLTSQIGRYSVRVSDALVDRLIGRLLVST